MIYFKIDVVAELKKRGWSSYRLKNEGIMGTQTLANIKAGKTINTDTLNSLCCILRCQPSDIIECRITDEEKIKYF